MTREEAIAWFENWLLDYYDIDDIPQDLTAELAGIALAALRQQDVTDTNVGSNEPLTLDELQKMDGEPVYIVNGDVSWWDIVSHSSKYFLFLTREEAMPFIRYGQWMAYRQKPEEGTR